MLSRKTFAIALTVFLAITALISNGRDIARHSRNGLSFVYRKFFTRRFITSRGCDGRLGNQLYRLISVYGIGRSTHRIPILPIGCKNNSKVLSTFPMLQTEFSFQGELPPPTGVNFGDDGSRADDTQRLINISSPYIALSGPYLQSYKYFHKYRDDVLKLLTCSPATVTQVEASATELFGSSSKPANIICVCIRRRDFVNTIYMASDTNFTGAALQYVLRKSSGNSTSNTSVVFLGDDPNWAKANFGSINGTHVYHRQMHSVEVDFCFAKSFCDAVLLTTSISSYGFWVGYGRSNLNSVFYPHKQQRFKGDHYYKDRFPVGWVALDERNGTVVEAELEL